MPAVRTVSQIDWNERLGGSGSALIGIEWPSRVYAARNRLGASKDNAHPRRKETDSILCPAEGIDFVLRRSLSTNAIHGRKANNDRINAFKIATLLRERGFDRGRFLATVS